MLLPFSVSFRALFSCSTRDISCTRTVSTSFSWPSTARSDEQNSS